MSVCQVLLGDLMFTVQHPLDLTFSRHPCETEEEKRSIWNHVHTFFWYCFSLSLCSFMLEFASQSKSAQQLPMQAYSRMARSRAEIFGTDWFPPMTKSRTSSPLGDSGAKMKCAVESDREGDRLSVANVLMPPSNLSVLYTPNLSS